MSEFVIGQRWISNTEADLGLGIASLLDHRHVTVTFPAAGEQRVYAKNNAPLTRVEYRIGDTIRDNDNKTLTVQNIDEVDGYITYIGLDEDDQPHKMGEVELDCFVLFSKPQDRLFAGQIDKLRDYQLRYRTLNQSSRLELLPAKGLIGPRVDLLEHQLYIAHEVGQRFAPRVLLADEVGLGKTIESGLIIHQQLTKGLSQRVLITVPSSLTHQWLVEMLRRFNLQFTLLDEERCQALEASEQDNPFDSAQLILCSLSLLTDHEQRLEQALQCDWDLLVVDEAHHLEWQPDAQSPAYDCIEQLAQHSRGLLLLTATPEQLGIASHFARLRLLDPDRYYDLQTFLDEQQSYQPINELVQRLLSAANTNDIDGDSIDQLQVKLGHDAIHPLLQSTHNDEFSTARDHIIDQLLDRHGTGRVLFRNTRSGVRGFPSRKLHSYSLTASDSTAFLDQPQVNWLSTWLKHNRQQKILVICSSAEDALDLETYLNLRGGFRTAAFHEGLSLLERDRAAAYFADLEDGAQVLVCSEIGSEGRNFQFAHHLVMFDLPENPDLIEQRIGRLDRIGQTETVNVHVPVAQGSHQEQLLRFLHEGLNCFETVCPIGQVVFEEHSETLHQIIEGNDVNALNTLITNVNTQTLSTLQTLQEGRDRLLELNSCKSDVAAELITELSAEDDSFDLINYMTDAFDTYGVDHEKHSEYAIIAHPSDHMQCEHFPGLPDEGFSATFDRTQALSRDDLHYLTWEHPMVTGVMDMIINSNLGNTSLCTIKLPPLKPGTLMVEALFQFSCPAPRVLQLQRFIENGCLRLLEDSNQRALENIITVQHLDKLGKQQKIAMAKQLVQHARSEIDRIIINLTERAHQQESQLIDAAKHKLHSYYDDEIERLSALAQVNPNIRPTELDYLRELQLQGEQFLDTSQLRLDAIRIAIAT